MRQVNLYIPGQNLTNLSLNVDYVRLGYDGIEIDVNFAVSPAEVTIKAGSILEANGNFYVQDEDYTFTMSNAAHLYIAYDGNTWASYATEGNYIDQKQGFYQADDIHRTVKFVINQTDETFSLLPLHLQNTDFYGITHVSASLPVNTALNTVATKILLTNEEYDNLNEYDAPNAKFTAKNAGLYAVHFNFFVNAGVGVNNNIFIEVRKNGLTAVIVVGATTYVDGGISGCKTIKLAAGDFLEFYGSKAYLTALTFVALNDRCCFTIDRVL